MFGDAPRHYIASGSMPGAGLPGQAAAPWSTRQAFVDLKNRFIDAVSALSGRDAAWLRQQVGHAEQPVDLWLLRGPLFEALERGSDELRMLRARLHRELDGLMPDTAAGRSDPILALFRAPDHGGLDHALRAGPGSNGVTAPPCACGRTAANAPIRPV